jgi:hypothetical protein
MTIIAAAATSRRATTRRAATGVCLVAAVALLGGCGSKPPAEPQPVVTLTITPTVTASATQPAPTTATTAASTVRSDVVGRKFDLGTIVRVEDEAGVPVIIFDRWSMQGLPDSAVAIQGVPIRVHSDAPYQNQNSHATYRIPVAPGAVFVYTHCVAIDQPAVQQPSTLNDFARLPEAENVVLLTLDPKGQVYRAQNDPAC